MDERRARSFEQARSIRVWSWLIGKRRRPLPRILENITFGVNSAVALLLIRRPDVVVLESWPVLATAAVMAVCAARSIKVINYVKDIYPEAAGKGRAATHYYGWWRVSPCPLNRGLR